MTFSLHIPAFTAEMNGQKLLNIYLDKYLLFGKEEGIELMTGELQI